MPKCACQEYAGDLVPGTRYQVSTTSYYTNSLLLSSAISFVKRSSTPSCGQVNPSVGLTCCILPVMPQFAIEHSVSILTVS